MPVRSLTSSVIRWPDASTVQEAVRAWSERLGDRHPEIVRIGFFGSYARGNWGVGSDLDLVIIVERSDRPFEARGSTFDATQLPVPVDLFVYTAEEWGRLNRDTHFLRTANNEAVWVYRRP